MRRRALVFAAASAAAVLVLLALGWWQLERRAWKEGLIAELETALKPDAAAMEVGDAERLLASDGGRDFARVRLSGRYLEGLDRYLFTVSAGAPGFRVLTPFLTGDGRLALVDRGFVPEDLKSRAAPAVGQATVEGLMHQARKPGLFAPPPDLVRHVWYWPDMPALLASLPPGDPGRPLPYLIEALPGAAADGWPRPDPPDPRRLPNNHLQYAITWFGLAAVFAVMTVVLLGGRGSADPDRPA